MEETPNIPDYKLEQDFLKDLVHDEDLKIKVPVFVQVIDIDGQVGDWNSYVVTDGEYKMERCAFVSKQIRPQCYSILKIAKISKLPLGNSHYIKDFEEGSYIQDIFGEIEFDIEIIGEKIGYSLCRDERCINIKEIKALSHFAREAKLKDLFKIDSSGEKIVRFMWENRSEKLCSVKFTFPNEQSAVVLAHKSVLMSVSEVFQTHFDNDRFVDRDSVPIVDTNGYYFNKFLEFIYLGKVQFTTVKVAFELLYLGKKYLMPNLEKICIDVIREYSDFASVNNLEVYTHNRKTKDDSIQDYLECNLRSGCTIRQIIHSVDFLNCDISVIEWILSLEDMDVDEWSLLCAMYKWACHNGVKTNCDKMEDESDISDESLDCLHRLLECIRFENIDMVSLQRFFKLPKLPEIVNVSEFKQYVFDCLLEDDSYFNNLQVGTKSYSKYRSGYSDIYTEIGIEQQQETQMKNIHLKDGPVLGLKIKVGQKETTAGKHSVDIFFSFQYLYTENYEESKPGQFHLYVTAMEFETLINEDIDDASDSFIGELNVGEPRVLKLHLKDYRSFLSDSIEDFRIENADDSKIEKVFGLEIFCLKI